MSKLSTLTKKQKDLLTQIREIEVECEGLENENNAKKVQELEQEQMQLSARKKELQSELHDISERLSAISTEIAEMSKTGVDQILEAIGNQRWYFIKNKPKVLLDRDTGLLWANLEYFPYVPSEGSYYKSEEIMDVISGFDFDGFSGFGIPEKDRMWDILLEGTGFPFHTGRTHFNGEYFGNDWYSSCYCFAIKASIYWLADKPGEMLMIEKTGRVLYCGEGTGGLLPCSSILVDGIDYEGNVSQENPAFTETERRHFTLDLFVQNDLLPVFTDDKITQLYQKIYFEKPALFAKLQDVQNQIKELQSISVLSSDFDYKALLSTYDIHEINSSVIQYHRAVQKWIDNLAGKLALYEQQMADVLEEFDQAARKLYEEKEELLRENLEQNEMLTEEEYRNLSERNQYFVGLLSPGFDEVREELLAVREQADAIEERIDEINHGVDAIARLAKLEQEDRVSFSLLAENTAGIVTSALARLDYFQNSKKNVLYTIDTLERWTENYISFGAIWSESREHFCLGSSAFIDERIWDGWDALRYLLEFSIEPLLERGIRKEMPISDKGKGTVTERVIAALEICKSNVDNFYLEKCRESVEKYSNDERYTFEMAYIEIHKEVYSILYSLQAALEKIIFHCEDVQDRIFLLEWIENVMGDYIDILVAFLRESIGKEIQFFHKKIYSMDAKKYKEIIKVKKKQYEDAVGDVMELMQEENLDIPASLNKELDE